jgi:hemerythrin superfamily protein
MATRTQTKGSKSTARPRSASKSPRSSTSRKDSGRSNDSDRSNDDRSAFSWGKGSTGAIVGAALAGVAVGLAANLGRKFVTQAVSGVSGDWDEVLSTEHDMTLAIFQKMLATDESQTWKRSLLLMQLTHALDKHAHEEEMVVYPALREANIAHDADALESEHGYMKTFIYELEKMGPSAPNWLEKVRNFRDLVAEHVRMEEQDVFPHFKSELTDEQNDEITSMVNKEGFWAS